MAGFGPRLREPADLLHGTFPAGHRFAGGATPQFVRPPPVWVMGSGPGSAAAAASVGADYAYSLFHRGNRVDPAVPHAFRRANPTRRIVAAASIDRAPTPTQAPPPKRTN